jgi:hypothetical protein
MRFIFLFLLAFNSNLILSDECKPKVKPSPTPNISVNKPLSTPVPTPKVIYRTVTIPAPSSSPLLKAEPCCEQKGVKVSNQNINQNRTGNQTVIVNVPKNEKPNTRTIIRERVRVKKVEAHTYVYRPNRLQLFLGLSKNKLEIEQQDCCDLSAKNSYQPDIGLQYLRDFGPITGSISGTVTGNIYFGLGFNW